MKVIHLLRKPLSEGTVASNTLKHGCGGLNIDESRLATGDNLNGGAYAENPTHRAGQDMWTRDRKGDTNCFKRGGAGHYEQPTGRWPANLILQHLDGCRCDGVKKVATNVQHHSYKRSGEGFIGSIKSQPEKAHWTNKETVANWICEPGCPVKALDDQSGDRPSWGVTHQPKRSGYSYRSEQDGGTNVYREPDTGGASRFFKQVGGNSE